MNTQATFRTSSFMIHKKTIQDTSDIIKQVREVAKSSADHDFKVNCIEMIFEARQLQANQIEMAKKEYPAINWTKYV